MSKEISTAYRLWLATLERGQTIDVEQAFAAGYRAGSFSGALKALDPSVVIDGRRYRRFIEYPSRVRDGTLRCILCGQIDEDGYHDDDVCRARVELSRRAATPEEAP